MLLTNNKILINAAKKYYDKFLVPTKLIKMKKLIRRYTNEDKADLDIKTAVNKIGEIINTSARLNVVLMEKLHEGKTVDDLIDLYCDIAQLDVMSNLEIKIGLAV